MSADTAANVAVTSQLKGGSYRKIISDILQTTYAEVCPETLESVQIQLITHVKDCNIVKEIFEAKNINAVFVLVLKAFDNDFKKLAKVMCEIIPKLIHDVPEEGADKMNHFLERMNRDSEEFYLEENLQIYGRDEQLKHVYDLLFSHNSASKHWVNVYGAPGIGKSYFVKKFASTMLYEKSVDVIYVDGRPLQSWNCILAKLLERLDVHVSALRDSNDMFGMLMRYVIENRTDTIFLMVLDDVDNLISHENGKQLFAEKIFRILQVASDHSVKLKIISTQTDNLDFSPEPNSVQPQTNSAMEKFISEFELPALDTEAAAEYFEASHDRLSDEMSRDLLAQCKGNPLSIHLIKVIAEQGYAAVSDMSSPLLESLLTDSLDSVTQRLLSGTFDELSPSQKETLLTVALYEGVAQLGSICKVKDSSFHGKDNEQKSEEYNALSTAFKSKFWINSITSDTHVEAEEKNVLSAYHPLILKFLRDKILTYETSSIQDKTTVNKLKVGYICHHISRLVEIGRLSMSSPSQASKIIVKERSNIIKALKLIIQMENPILLFKLNTWPRDLTNRSLSDILLLFLTLHEYHDEFGNTVIDLAKLAVSSNAVLNMRTKVLIWTLYAMMLSKKEDWTLLADALVKLSNDADPKSLPGDKSLSLFCESIKYYAEACSKSHNKDDDTGRICNKAINKLKALQENYGLQDTNQSRLYFTAHVEMLKARAHIRKFCSYGNTAQECIDICKKAKKHNDIANVRCVMARVDLDLADYYIQKALMTTPFKKAYSCLKASDAKLKESDMTHTTQAWQTLRIIANHLIRIVTGMKVNYAQRNRAEIDSYLKEAKVKLLTLYDQCYLNSLWGGPQRMLFNTRIYVGSKFSDIAEFYLQLGDTSNHARHQRITLQFFCQAFNKMLLEGPQIDMSHAMYDIKILSGSLPQLLSNSGNTALIVKVEGVKGKLETLLATYKQGQIPSLMAECADSDILIPVHAISDPHMYARHVQAVQPTDSMSNTAGSTEQPGQSTSTTQAVDDLSPTKEVNSVCEAAAASKREAENDEEETGDGDKRRKLR